MRLRANLMTLGALCAIAVGVSALFSAQTKSASNQPSSSAQPAKAAAPTITSVLDRQFSNLEREFVSAADAMPENKFDFVPSSGEFKGVRKFALQVKHVAATNYLVSAAIVGETPPAGSENDNGPDNLKTKAEIMDYLRQSMAYTHRAIATVNAKDMLESVKNPFGQGTTTKLALANIPTWHSFDHYGQMVEYLRMNGIIPPASRR